MYEGPEFRHLTHFIALAEECNFGRAAAKIHTTQPNLTRSTLAPLTPEGYAPAAIVETSPGSGTAVPWVTQWAEVVGRHSLVR